MKREKQISYNRPAPVEGLPESPELERAVLGALILEPDQLSDVTEIVGISALSDPNNGKIYGAMLSMLEQGNKIDLCMLSQHPELKGREMVRYLVELTNSIGSAVNVLDHARQLADIEARRRLIMLSYEIAAKSSAGTNSAEEICELVTNQIAALVSTTARVSDLIPLSDAVRATIDNLELRQQERQAGQCIGIPTGLQRLDALTGGWRGGQLVVLAGRPGTGKSAMMLHFARAAAVSGVPVCVYSLEMCVEQLTGRMLVGSSGVSSGEFRTGNVDASGWTKIEKAGAKLSAMPVYLNDRANLTIGAIRSQCKAMRRRDGAGWSLSTTCNCSIRQAVTRTTLASVRSPPPAVRPNCWPRNSISRLSCCRSCPARLRTGWTKGRYCRTCASREPSSRTPTSSHSSIGQQCMAKPRSTQDATGLFRLRGSGYCTSQKTARGR